MTLVQRTIDGFSRNYGHAPDGVTFAPGRVNLMGEHVDYNDGLVLPMPIAAGTAVAWRARAGDEICAVALDLSEARDRFSVTSPESVEPIDWRAYLRGMTAEMRAAGLPVGGAELAIAGSIPRGSGLSSSASLCIALGRALAAAAGAPDPASRELALAAQAAEHRWAGVQCGIMDQMAIAAGTPGRALLLDCRSLATRIIPLPADWAVMIVQSGVRRGLVDGYYNQRRRDCEAAAAAMGIPMLRDASIAMVEGAKLDETVRRRVTHVVNEIARTEATVAGFERADLVAVGEAMRTSHASLRDLFAVSVPAVDDLVDCLNAEIGSAGGARMTGGGFGGAVVAVLEASAVTRVTAAIQKGYHSPCGGALEIMVEDGRAPHLSVLRLQSDTSSCVVAPALGGAIVA